MSTELSSKYFLPPVALKLAEVFRTDTPVLRGEINERETEKILTGYVKRYNPSRLIRYELWKDEMNLRATNTSLASDEVIQELIFANQEGLLGDGYLVQTTVQGRLPDKFKIAGIAFLVSFKSSRNWEIPMFNAPWGKVSPLIHDGGAVDYDVNPLWKVKGRTDLIGDLVKVYQPNSTLEKLTNERVKYFIDTYRFLGFGAHCEFGTAPQEIPEPIRERAKNAWREFDKRMIGVLNEFDLMELYHATWFNREPRQLKDWENYGLRYEADYAPIQAGLIEMEARKKQFPSICDIAENNIIAYSNYINNLLESNINASNS